MPLIPSRIVFELSRHSLSRIYIGYSGGLDSHVLLHVCTQLPELKGKITAVYVHHGLQVEADSWGEHCRQIAQELGVKFELLQVDAQPKLGESPEEAARNARYAAFKALIGEDCALLVAQHREDQLETVLLQLFRGSGLKGLSGMPVAMAFGQGMLLRPLLSVAKQDIMAYAQAQQLFWVEDPSNQQNDYDRNFLRNQVLPLLKQRWPAVDKTVSRAALHCSESETLISRMVEPWFWAVFDPTDLTLGLGQLSGFDRQQQQHVIRAWFQHLGLKMPSYVFIEEVLTNVVGARSNSSPNLQGQGIYVRRYRDKLYCLQPDSVVAAEIAWPRDMTSVAIGASQLSYYIAPNGICFEQWQNSQVTVKFRTGGEKITLPKRQGHHSLKKLFQEAAIPPWQRETMPLVYLNGVLAAVGNRWISADFYSEAAKTVRLVIKP